MNIYECQKCGKKLYRQSKTGLCTQCVLQKRREDIPSKQQLIKDYEQLYTLKAISEKYHKTINAIWRWFKFYDIKTNNSREEKDYNWYCQTCDQHFDSLTELRRHKSTHPHKCKYCGQIFNDVHKLGAHMYTCILNPKRDQNIKKRKQNHPHNPPTEQVKKRISDSMKKAHAQGRAHNIGQSRWNN